MILLICDGCDRVTEVSLYLWLVTVWWNNGVTIIYNKLLLFDSFLDDTYNEVNHNNNNHDEDEGIIVVEEENEVDDQHQRCHYYSDDDDNENDNNKNKILKIFRYPSPKGRRPSAGKVYQRDETDEDEEHGLQLVQRYPFAFPIVIDSKYLLTIHQ